MKKQILSVITTAALISSLSVSSAFAFTDLTPEQQGPITSLAERGIVNGVGAGHFVPQEKITYAESIQLLVKAFDLNLAAVSFIKAPAASDFFTKVPNDAWYAEAFISAKVNGLEIPEDIDPNSTITREQFADLLIQALELKGDVPIVHVMMLVVFADGDEIDPSYSGRIQRLVLYKIMTPGEDNKFYPKRELTRGEASLWVYNALQLKESLTEKPSPSGEVSLTVEKVTEEVNKVVLSRGQKPTTGYSIKVDAIRFTEDGQAIISYSLGDPAPGSMNGEMITEPKAEAYIPANYQPVLDPSASVSATPQVSTTDPSVK
ncbi:S-layer homology domain-containing protein [Brevibacillus sp. B_LB10_24]|uniref:S-layer homology domain-containing protein n=1 Tax=Brevibacillus sp. B_LB10_24 TaxID=3380645 RepID=UPI0038BDB02A